MRINVCTYLNERVGGREKIGDYESLLSGCLIVFTDGLVGLATNL